MVEVHVYLVPLHAADHTGQLALAGVSKGDHDPGLQHHVGTELMAFEGLDIARVVLAKRLLGGHFEGLAVPRLEPHQVGLKILRQVLITDLQRGRILVKGRVDHLAVSEFQGKMQGYSGSLINGQIFHGYQSLPSAAFAEGLRKISRIIMPAPMVIAVSARLNAGKCQSCQ